MPSSISSSKTSQWKHFCLWVMGTVVGLFALLYGFIVLVDPWGMLPLSLPLARIPISSNARFSFPMLAVNEQFDSAIFGTSTARLIRPTLLDQTMGTHFVNLAVNSASPWEQSQLFNIFMRTHPTPKVVIFSLDTIWCLATETGIGITNRVFPYWMYNNTPWAGYKHMANLYALQEAANQFLWLTGYKHQQYGGDGYTRFVPEEKAYDFDKVKQHFAQWALPNNSAAKTTILPEPALDILAHMLNQLPESTLKIIIFPPLYAGLLGTPESWTNIKWKSCKKRAISLANSQHHIFILDFATPSAWTQDMHSFWDPLHYRQPIADMIANDISLAVKDPTYAHSVMQRLLP